MALTHLIDTSVVTRLGRDGVAQKVLGFGAGAVGRCAMTDLEVGFSASNAGEWDRLQHSLGSMTAVDVLAIDFDAALRTQKLLASAGLKGRKVADLLIASSAQRRKLTVLHYDHDFDHIATVTGQSVEWIVPSGSID